MRKFKYFVHYAFKKFNNPNIGGNNTVFTCTRKISPNLIRNFEKHLINKEGFENVVIKNSKLL